MSPRTAARTEGATVSFRLQSGGFVIVRVEPRAGDPDFDPEAAAVALAKRLEAAVEGEGWE